jgi:hypothetical protein
MSTIFFVVIVLDAAPGGGDWASHSALSWN